VDKIRLAGSHDMNLGLTDVLVGRRRINVSVVMLGIREPGCHVSCKMLVLSLGTKEYNN